MDRDRNKIFDSLDATLAQASDQDLIPVLIMARRAEDLPAIEKAAGKSNVKHRYQVVPAIAASVTKAQIQVLAGEPGVVHIEYDAEVRICQGSTDYFGVTKARQDFGVSGNRDGQPGYSKDDIVTSVVEPTKPQILVVVGL